MAKSGAKRSAKRRLFLPAGSLCLLLVSLSGCKHSSNNDPSAHAADAVGLDCSGSVLKRETLPVNSTALNCSSFCDEHESCHAWSFDHASRGCELREYCSNFVFAQPKVQAGWKPHSPEPLLCPQPEAKLDCPGNDLTVVENQTFSECCDACHATMGCMVFTLETAAGKHAGADAAGSCHLKSRCPKKNHTKSSAFHTGWMQRPGRKSFEQAGGPSPYYKVGRGWFNVTGYVCGDHYPATAVWYPIGPGPWSVVIMRPGKGGQLDKMDDWLVSVASLGMVVISPFTDAGTCADRSWQDLLTILDVLLRQGLQCIGCVEPPGALDFNSVAFMGHSMGAMAATQASYMVRNSSAFPLADNVTVRAVVASHDAYGVDEMPDDVAFLVTGGDWDGRMDQNGVNQTYHASPSRSKIGACMHEAPHMEPVPNEKLSWGGGGARENWWSAQFLACHLGPQDTRRLYCDRVYGNSSSSMAKMHQWAVFLSSDYDEPLVPMQDVVPVPPEVEMII